MKVLTIGNSPYQFFSAGKINSLILRHLYLSGYHTAGLVVGHDAALFVPDEDKLGNKRFHYKFTHEGKNHQIPIAPYKKDENEVTTVYELLNAISPDAIITIGDFLDFLYMTAIKRFYTKPFRWIFVMTNHFTPNDKTELDILKEVDEIIHVSEFSRSMTPVDTESTVVPVGHDHKIFHSKNRSKAAPLRIMVSGKNSQSDNIPMVAEAVAEILDEHPDYEIQLIIYANLFDPGDYNLGNIIQEIDQDGKFTVLPKEFVSMFEGYSDQKLASTLRDTDLFISPSMISSSSSSIYEAIACGCIPLVVQGTADEEAVNRCFTETKDMVVRSVPVRNTTGGYLRICDLEDLKEKIVYFYHILREGKGAQQSKLVCKYTNEVFLQEISDLVCKIEKIDPDRKQLSLIGCG